VIPASLRVALRVAGDGRWLRYNPGMDRNQAPLLEAVALHLAHAPSPEQVADAWERHPEAAGALVVSPTPYGTRADIAAIAEVCHERGRPLIVDEAWRAHLPFHPDLPTWAMDAGADVREASVHKMGARRL
jgi:arginine/lysine/ornithine decarboxylase